MYGRGTYFHDMASYSYNFAFQKGGDKVQLFCAKVLIGKTYVTPPNGQLTVPPFVPGSKSVRYDSIRSNNQIGKNEYVIFNNSKAYPYYLLTISANRNVNNPNAFGFGAFNNNAAVYSSDDEDYDEDKYDDDEEEEDEDYGEY